MVSKILVFSDCYIFGGSEKLVSFLVNNQMLNNEYDISFAYRKHKLYEEGLKNENLLDSRNTYPINLLSNETLFYKINCLSLNRILKVGMKIPFFIIQKLQVYSLWNLILLISLLKKLKPAIIHINNGGYPGAKSCNIMVLANFLASKSKIVYQVNNQARSSNNYLSRQINKFISKNVNYFTTASLESKGQLVNKIGITDDKIFIINNCVPYIKAELSKQEICRDLGIPEDSFIIVQIGFLTERKGQKYLIEAFINLLNRDEAFKKEFYLLLIGNGEDEESLLKLIKDNDLQNNVRLLGYRTNVEDFIQASDVFVLPSIKDEDMPLVVLTALSQGKAIVASDFAGISQVINTGYNGILIQNDIVEFASQLEQKIFMLYNDADLRGKLGDNAKISYKQYTPETYGLRFNEIYTKLI